MKRALGRTLIALTISLTANAFAFAQPKVEIAPGVAVTRRTYPAPITEAPFFNFAEKNEAQKAADRELVSKMIATTPDSAQASDKASNAGWKALMEDSDYATAAKRFNQAYLLDPKRSLLYQGFAAVAAGRFRDFDFADELMTVAARMDAPSPALSADHGRILLMAGRFAQARALLERAVKDDPDWAIPRSNLAWAVLLSGSSDPICPLVEKVKGRDIDKVQSDLDLLKKRAGCR